MKVAVRNDLAETFIGFYDHIRRRPGDVFSINDTNRRALFPSEKSLIDVNDAAREAYERVKDRSGQVPKDYSFRWMQPVSADTPDKTSTAQQALTAKSDNLKLEKAAAKAIDAGSKTADVL